MSPGDSIIKDLIVLVADISQEKTISTLLERRCRLSAISLPSFDIYRHAENDPGVYNKAGVFLSIFADLYRYSLVIVDAAWDGCPSSAEEIATHIQAGLDYNGWLNRSAVVVINPELEIWVWSSSPHVPKILGTDWATVRRIGESRNYWGTGELKPHSPKELYLDILRISKKRQSSAIFAELAQKVGIQRCHDESFTQLCQVLELGSAPSIKLTIIIPCQLFLLREGPCLSI